MKTLLSWVSLCAMAIILAGCSGPGYTSLPCSSCKWGAKNTQGPMSNPVAYCMVDGKKVDCKASPAQCPECAKAPR